MKQMAIMLIEEAVGNGARQSKACEILEISCRSFRRWKSEASCLVDQRRQAAQNRSCSYALTTEEKERMIEICNSPEYQSLPPSQIVPKLADKGMYMASESSFYRVLKAYGQNHRRGRAQHPRAIAKPRACVAQAPNQVWTWDITFLPTIVRGQFYRLYMAVDLFSRRIMAWEVHNTESAEQAATLIEKACGKYRIKKDQLILHSDNGSPMKGATMLATLQKLGIMPSFNRPSVSNDNPYSESLFRTLKYTPAYPSKPFEDIDQAKQWVHQFVRWYNDEHQHSGIQFVTPSQRYHYQDRDILKRRCEVYEQAKKAMPQRWGTRATRNWSYVSEVWLNPSKPHNTEQSTLQLAA
jgi:transposase InsO family protein